MCKCLHEVITNLMVPLQLVILSMNRGLCLCLPALHTCNAMLQVPCRQQHPEFAKGTLQVLFPGAPWYEGASSCLTSSPAWRPSCAACVETAATLATPPAPPVRTCR